MKAAYTVADPMKTITLLVTSPAEPSLRSQLGARLLPLEKDARQVAFLDRPEDGPRLEMFGGEFDAGAVMAAASLLAFEEHPAVGESRELRLRVSGAPDSVACTVTPVRTCDLVTVTMPLPTGIADRTFPLSDGSITFPVVSFPGICHIIVPAGTVDRTAAREVLAHWSDLLNAPAVGMLFWNEEARTADPLVYRKAAAASEWLPTSADGAAAIAAWLTQRRQADQSVSVRQPGGTAAAVTRWQNGLISLTVSGTVVLKKDASAEVVF